MSELKDFLVKRIGHDYETLEHSCWYLARLSIAAATEIDNYLHGRNNDFSHVQELAEILKKFQLRDTDTALTEPNFPYNPIFRILRKNTKKTIEKYPEVALEMRLLRAELETVPSKRMEELRSLLHDLSLEFSDEQLQHDYPYQLVC